MTKDTAEELTSTVKGFHQKLRVLFECGKPLEVLWREHVSDRSGLQVYSDAMRRLATGPWAEREEGDRVSWCVQACNEYLSHRLEWLLLKDLRRLNHDMLTLIHPTLLPATSSKVGELVSLLRSREWRLLDVGSCYNPFLAWTQFVVTAIDIAPAIESVLECDFLSVDFIQKELNPAVLHKERRTRDNCSHLYADYYDVVVFSLLLSYLPSTEQRLTCCVNAHQALQLHGLLLIVTPDSSHQNRHAALMVKWRQCIEAVGFHRWKYEKLSHLHCMAFRKTEPTRLDYSNAMLQHTLLAIPQDNGHAS